jgi:hypothetical protein
MCTDLIFLNKSFSCHLLRITFLEHETTKGKENNELEVLMTVKIPDISSILRVRGILFNIQATETQYPK